MDYIKEQSHWLEGLISEAEIGRSRDSVIIDASQSVHVGSVLGRKNPQTTRKAEAAAFEGNTGNGTIVLAATPFTSAAKAGKYSITCVTAAANGGTFRVDDPNGVTIGNATVGNDFSGEIAFKINDGTTDFAVGDGFFVTISDPAFKVTTAFTGTGNGAIQMAQTPIAEGAADGDYTATCVQTATNGGVFEVKGPRGNLLGQATVGVDFDGLVKFKINDGATDFAVGDKFTITLKYLQKSFRWAVWKPSATDGTEVARAIALYPASTGQSETKTIAAIARDAQWRAQNLVFDASVPLADRYKAREQLAEYGIVIRD